MEYKRGIPREQTVLFSDSLDSIIEDDNPVRVIDAYINFLDLEKLGFKIPALEVGTPPYNPEVLLKIYIYGYLERIRSSRKLEKECKRNNELIWLTESLKPDHWTISNFRKNNKKGINNVFKEFLNFCNSANLLSLETVGIDGTRIRSHVGSNNIYSRKTIDKVKKRIDEKIFEYLEDLEKNDASEDEEIGFVDDSEKIKTKLIKMKKVQNKVENIKKKFEEDTSLTTYFATDEDARFQKDKGRLRPGYNGQIAVDDKNKLIIANYVINKSTDSEELTPMVNEIQELKEKYEIKNNTDVITDAGYFGENEILNNKDKEGISLAVSCIRREKKTKIKSGKEKVPALGFDIKYFVYNKEKDVFICPEGKKLYKLYKNPSTESSGRLIYIYKCKECNVCKKQNMCTKCKTGRAIKISVNRDKMENFKKEMLSKENKKLLKRRKEIVEHPFGTMKTNWGFTNFIQKGLGAVNTEFSLFCFIYNFRRVINILGVKNFIKEIKRQYD